MEAPLFCNGFLMAKLLSAWRERLKFKSAPGVFARSKVLIVTRADGA